MRRLISKQVEVTERPGEQPGAELDDSLTLHVPTSMTIEEASYWLGRAQSLAGGQEIKVEYQGDTNSPGIDWSRWDTSEPLRAWNPGVE